MSRSGSTLGMLYDLHADGCDGTEYSACRPVVRDDPEDRGQQIDVVMMAWCSDCNAAEFEVV